jgi:hypothetical protein
MRAALPLGASPLFLGSFFIYWGVFSRALLVNIIDAKFGLVRYRALQVAAQQPLLFVELF